VLAAHLGDGSEDEAVRQLFTIRPESVPNLHVLWLADEILGRDGRLFDALVRFESSNAEYFDYHRNRRAETLKISPGLYARGLPEGVTGIHRFVREQAMVTSPVGLTAR
jgi:hypothetical protein